MGKVEKKIREIKAIRILFIFDFAIILVLLFFFFHLGFFSIGTYIFFPLLLVCISLQLLFYFVPNGKVIFDSIGITIITKHTNDRIDWEDVKQIYYRPFGEFFPFLDHFTLDLWIKIDGKTIDFDTKFGSIKIYEKEYLDIISFIPRYILDVNDFMIYRNIIEKEENKYKK